MMLWDESGFSISYREQNVQKLGGNCEPLVHEASERGYELRIGAGGSVGPGGQGRDRGRPVLCLACSC